MGKKATTGGGGNGGPNRGRDQRPQRKIDETHTRDAIVVDLKLDQDISDMIKNNTVVLIHDSSEPGYSLYNHLVNGGVDFAHLDYAQISDQSDRAVKIQENKKVTGSKTP